MCKAGCTVSAFWRLHLAWRRAFARTGQLSWAGGRDKVQGRCLPGRWWRAVHGGGVGNDPHPRPLLLWSTHLPHCWAGPHIRVHAALPAAAPHTAPPPQPPPGGWATQPYHWLPRTPGGSRGQRAMPGRLRLLRGASGGGGAGVLLGSSHGVACLLAATSRWRPHRPPSAVACAPQATAPPSNTTTWTRGHTSRVSRALLGLLRDPQTHPTTKRAHPTPPAPLFSCTMPSG